MELEVEMTREDYGGFNRYYFFNKGLKKRLNLMIGIILIVPLIIQSGKPFSIELYLKEAGTFVLYLLPVLSISYLVVLNKIRKLPDKDGSLLGYKKFIFNDECLIEETKYNRNEYRWKGVKSIESNQKYIFIFVDNMAAYVIPKRYFSSENETNSFIATLNNYMNKAQ